MKAHFLSLLAFFLLSLVKAQAQPQPITLTVIINSPQGSSEFSGGSYTNGSSVNVEFDAVSGWYITNVVLKPAPSNVLNFQELLLLNSLGSHPDPTTLTSDNESLTLVSNSTLTVTFATLAPVITKQPTNQTVVTGSTATLTAGAFGRQPLSYQWFFNSNAISGGNASSLTLSNLQSTNAGNYSVVVTNSYGATNSAPVTLTVSDFLVFTNGQPVGVPAFTNLSQVVISLQSRFLSGPIFYTLDGSPPDFGSTGYSGAFTVNTTCTLRAIAYSGDLSQSVVVGPFNISIIPTFIIDAYTSGGGSITLNPSSQPYVSNTVVTVIATPALGFTFMSWAGGAVSGNNLTNTVTVKNNVGIQAYFGTSFSTTVNGSGTVSTFPAFPLYPYGTQLKVTAVPNPGNYFGLWGNAASGSQNPLNFTVTSANPSVSALFGALPTNQVSLTLGWDGAGFVSANPATNKCPIGTTIVLTANSFGPQFLGWSGDASGTTNPLSVVMNSSKNIVAHFSHSPVLSFSASGSLLQCAVIGFAGDTFQIQTSTGSLTNWVPFLTLTNLYNGPVLFSDTVSSNTGIRVYRAVVQ